MLTCLGHRLLGSLRHSLFDCLLDCCLFGLSHLVLGSSLHCILDLLLDGRGGLLLLGEFGMVAQTTRPEVVALSVSIDDNAGARSLLGHARDEVLIFNLLFVLFGVQDVVDFLHLLLLCRGGLLVSRFVSLHCRVVDRHLGFVHGCLSSLDVGILHLPLGVLSLVACSRHLEGREALCGLVGVVFVMGGLVHGVHGLLLRGDVVERERTCGGLRLDGLLGGRLHLLLHALGDVLGDGLTRLGGGSILLQE